MRMTATSRRNLEAATEVRLHSWPDGKCYVMAWRDGIPAQVHAGDGPMIYPSTAAATRAVARVTSAPITQIVPVH